MAKVKAEEVFGGVSECRGMGATTVSSNRGKVPKGTETRIPRYHEGEQADSAAVVPDKGPITEQELCSHF